MTIYLTMRDGSKRGFVDNGATGGSYTQTMRYQPGFVEIIDAYGKVTAIPTDLIAEIEQEAPRRW